MDENYQWKEIEKKQAAIILLNIETQIIVFFLFLYGLYNNLLRKVQRLKFQDISFECHKSR